MNPPDFSGVHPVLLARLRQVIAKLPEPPQGTAAEAAEAVTLERWTTRQDRWGLLRLDGVLVAYDGYEFSFRATPLLVDVPQRLMWTAHGWMRLGSQATQPEGEHLVASLEDLEHWCAALRRVLLDS